MANELTITAAFSCIRDIIVVQSSGTKTSTQNPGTKAAMSQLSVGTTAGQLLQASSLGLASCGYLFVKNTDANGYVELSMDSGVSSPFTKLLPSEFCLIPVNKSAAVPNVYAKASVALNVLVCAAEM